MSRPAAAKPVSKPPAAATKPVSTAAPAPAVAPAPVADVTAAAPTPAALSGYWLLTTNGGVFTHGSLAFYGAASATPPVTDAVALVPTTDAKGYWMATAKGQVSTYGDALSFGTLDPSALGAPVRALVPTPDGMGYWLVTSVGGVFSFGDAAFFGAGPADHPLTDVIGMASTPDGQGYWLATSTGQVLAFGDAKSYGNGDPAVLQSPVVSFVPTADGLGYWMATANGGVFSFGDATFYGSQWSAGNHDPIVALTSTGDGAGYWITTAGGAVTAYGDADPYTGSAPDPVTAPAVGLAVPRSGALADVPVAYISVEHQAAATCTGLSWTVLAGIAKVESDFGRSPLPGVTSGANYAGVAGPMQIGIGGAAGLTFAANDHPVPADEAATPAAGAVPANPYDLLDATFAAARDLCSNGAGDPATLPDAVLAYNDSFSYVDEVLSLSDMYGAGASSSSAAVRLAATQLGVPYVWGGITPNQGFDCSGLVQWAYRAVGVDLPRTSQEQWLAVAHLPAGSPLQPGDLLFFGPADGPTHVGMYVGGGLMIDAPHTGAVVRIEPYHWSDFLGVGRP